jgi:probable F420-dependent oxidoreductase
MKLERIGIWTAQFDFQPAAIVRETIQELEALGYGSVWIGENVGREPISQAAMLLAATKSLVVATAVANIWARDPLSMLAAQQTLSEAYPKRFILGIGVSHPQLVNEMRGLRYGQPVEAMERYLTAMDELTGRYRAVRADETTRIVGALGPRMTRLAASLSDGVHTYLTTPEHTATARKHLGPDKLLVPEQAVVLETDRAHARAIARQHVRRYLNLRSYTDNLRRLGFTAKDFEDNGSDRLVDSLVAWGDEETIARRIDQHVRAGADQVCLHVLDSDFRGLPIAQWRRLAALAPIG